MKTHVLMGLALYRGGKTMQEYVSFSFSEDWYNSRFGVNFEDGLTELAEEISKGA